MLLLKLNVTLWDALTNANGAFVAEDFVCLDCNCLRTREVCRDLLFFFFALEVVVFADVHTTVKVRLLRNNEKPRDVSSCFFKCSL